MTWVYAAVAVYAVLVAVVVAALLNVADLAERGRDDAAGVSAHAGPRLSEPSARVPASGGNGYEDGAGVEGERERAESVVLPRGRRTAT